MPFTRCLILARFAHHLICRVGIIPTTKRSCEVRENVRKILCKPWKQCTFIKWRYCKSVILEFVLLKITFGPINLFTHFWPRIPFFENVIHGRAYTWCFLWEQLKLFWVTFACAHRTQQPVNLGNKFCPESLPARPLCVPFSKAAVRNFLVLLLPPYRQMGTVLSGEGEWVPRDAACPSETPEHCGLGRCELLCVPFPCLFFKPAFLISYVWLTH